MYAYNSTEVTRLFSEILQQNISEEAFKWLSEKTSSAQNANQFNTTFVTLPRKTGKQPIKVSGEQIQRLQSLRPGLHIESWSADRLARAWLILHLDPTDKEKYFKTVENLFLAAEVNELVALYSSLPLFAYPELWKARCAEGIRNNIGDVLTAIMCNNPYPSEQLGEAAWNQLVLKAFFTEKPINEIEGLDERTNNQLAKTLTDFAHERWAAHRDISPLIWRCVSPFIDDSTLPDLKKLLSSGSEMERKAAALAIYYSNNAASKKLLPEQYKNDILNGKLSWKSLSDKTNDYVLQQ